MTKHFRQSRADWEKAKDKKSLLKKDIAEWQIRADKTDYDDEGGPKYNEVSLKAMVDEARTLLQRCSLDL